MKIHEYQAKAILARYGVTTPRGEVAFTKEEAREAAQRLKTPVVVKFMTDEGLDPVGSTPAELTALLRREIAKYGRTIEVAGIKL